MTDLWIRRAAIISQLKHRDATDHARLFRYCLDCAGDSDFFISKAIGWALRQYSYTAADRVGRFFVENGARLSPLSYREAARVMVKRGTLRGCRIDTCSMPAVPAY